ncbi:MAG: hypothetical protein M0R33_15250 [Methylomonas sp.]|jgi:hypothetical protein|uniref:hypothetical protein n=1 Tax=Methylomonas sp. TaxID=418 RepID=UPI0025D56AFC|nr:hypothetical protein [Methylomonas sp.]MCK9607798.1 hypothetical protein [Methylomonas sp.]
MAANSETKDSSQIVEHSPEAKIQQSTRVVGEASPSTNTPAEITAAAQEKIEKPTEKYTEKPIEKPTEKPAESTRVIHQKYAQSGRTQMGDCAPAEREIRQYSCVYRARPRQLAFGSTATRELPRRGRGFAEPRIFGDFSQQKESPRGVAPEAARSQRANFYPSRGSSREGDFRRGRSSPGGVEPSASSRNMRGLYYVNSMPPVADDIQCDDDVFDSPAQQIREARLRLDRNAGAPPEGSSLRRAQQSLDASGGVPKSTEAEKVPTASSRGNFRGRSPYAHRARGTRRSLDASGGAPRHNAREMRISRNEIVSEISLPEFDKLASLPEILAKLSEKAIAEHVSSQSAFAGLLMTALNPLGLLIKHEPAFTSGLVSITIDRKSCNFASKICRATNGVVIDIHDYSCKILAALPSELNSSPSLNKVFGNLEKYDIFEAKDGTIVTLYYDIRAGRWRIASSFAFDISTYTWMGNKTYAEILQDAWSQMQSPTTSGVSSFFSALNKEKTYAIGIHHPDFHPLYNVTESENKPRNSSGGAEIWIVDGPDIPGITRQQPINRADTAESIQHILSSALNKFLTTRAIHHGFVLRAKPEFEEELGADANVCLESSLRRAVVKHVYDIPREMTMHLDNTTRLNFMSLRAYLNPTAHSEFLVLFPHAAEFYAKMDYIIERISSIILAKMRATGDAAVATSLSGSAPSDESGVKLFGDKFTSVVKSAEIAANNFLHSFRAADINPFSQESTGLLRDLQIGTERRGEYMRFMDVL